MAATGSDVKPYVAIAAAETGCLTLSLRQEVGSWRCTGLSINKTQSSGTLFHQERERCALVRNKISTQGYFLLVMVFPLIKISTVAYFWNVANKSLCFTVAVHYLPRLNTANLEHRLRCDKLKSLRFCHGFRCSATCQCTLLQRSKIAFVLLQIFELNWALQCRKPHQTLIVKN